MMVASIVTARAFMIFEKAISQSVQVLGFMRLGLTPNMRNGTENGPRKAIGICRFCQQPRHSVDGSGVIAFPRRRAVCLTPCLLKWCGILEGQAGSGSAEARFAACAAATKIRPIRFCWIQAIRHSRTMEESF